MFHAADFGNVKVGSTLDLSDSTNSNTTSGVFMLGFPEERMLGRGVKVSPDAIDLRRSVGRL